MSFEGFEIDMDLVASFDAPTLAQGCFGGGGEPAVISEYDSGDGIVRTDEQMRAWAEHLDCDFQVAGEDELFIDIDSNQALIQFDHVWPVVGKHFGTSFISKEPGVVITPSKSGGEKRHIRVKLGQPQPLLARIALQAALGSDGRREAISVLRALRGEENVVVFFEPISLRSSEHKSVKENL